MSINLGFSGQGSKREGGRKEGSFSEFLNERKREGRRSGKKWVGESEEAHFFAQLLAEEKTFRFALLLEF